MPEIDWHFPRSDLATAYLLQFRTGLAHSITLFAPRRKGKTEFLLEDLAPAAEEEGYKVCYVSLWALKTDPAAALLAGLVDAGLKQSMWQRAKNLLKTPIRSMDAEAGIGAATVSVGADFADDKPATKADLLEIPRALDKLVPLSSNGKVLLLLDEVQFLAKPVHEHLVAALRTALDTRKATVRTVFTGSSRVRLQEMFDTIKAPLFQFSQHTHFPDLDQNFTRFMAENYRKVTHTVLDEEVAWAGFEFLGRSPGLFRDALTAMVMRGSRDFMGICHVIREGAESRANMIGVWSRLKPMDQLVVRSVLAGVSLYAVETRTKMAQSIGVDEVTNNQVQAVLNRLLADQILFSKRRGEYEIEDDGFREWLVRYLNDVDMSDPTK